MNPHKLDASTIQNIALKLLRICRPTVMPSQVHSHLKLLKTLPIISLCMCLTRINIVLWSNVQAPTYLLITHAKVLDEGHFKSLLFQLFWLTTGGHRILCHPLACNRETPQWVLYARTIEIRVQANVYGDNIMPLCHCNMEPYQRLHASILTLTN